MVAKIEWRQGEFFPRIGLVISNSRSSSAPLSGGADLGYLGRKSMRCLLTKWRCALNFKKKTFSGKNMLPYRTVEVEIRRQEQKLCGAFPWQRGPQNHFLTVAAKAAA